MFIHQYIKRGSNHPDYCEDYTIISEKDDYMLLGVLTVAAQEKNRILHRHLPEKLYVQPFKN